MNLLWKISGVVAAAALLGSAVVPLSISACPAATAKAKACCCCKTERPAGAPRHCPCKNPAGEFPGSPCAIQKTLPSSTLPPVTAPVADGSHLAVIPPPALFSVAPLVASLQCHRIEPGWDPGNFGLIVPLRL